MKRFISEEDLVYYNTDRSKSACLWASHQVQFYHKAYCELYYRLDAESLSMLLLRGVPAWMELLSIQDSAWSKVTGHDSESVKRVKLNRSTRLI